MTLSTLVKKVKTAPGFDLDRYPDIEAHRANAQEILKLLNKTGQPGRGLFDCWLQLVLAELDGPSTAVAQALEDITARYRSPQVCLALIEAGALLRKSQEWGYYDILGPIFAEFANPNTRSGQFFTPMGMADLMARMTIMDGEKEVLDRLEAAAERAGKENPRVPAMITAISLGTLLVAPGKGVEDIERWQVNVLFDELLPAILPYYEPFSICDPCVGAGCTLLAAAAQFPVWMVRAGFVELVGLDIDPTCVLMTQVVFKIFHINGGRTLRCNALTATDAELARLDPVSHSFYRRARDAFRQGGMEAVQPYIEEANRARQELVAGQVVSIPLLEMEPA